MDNLSAAFFAAPPIARTLAAVVLVSSLGIQFGLVNARLLVFHSSYLWRFPPQIWRCATSFLIASSGLNLLFDTYFFYHYMCQLEVGHPRFTRKADLIWYMIFVGGTILTIDSFVGLGFMVYLRALLLAMAYTVTQGQRGMTANFYFINIPAQLTPYAMIAVNLLFPGGVPNMILQLEGLVAAHLFEFLTVIWPQYGGTGNSLLPTPPVLVKLVDALSGVTERVGAAAQGRAADSSAGRSTGADSGPLPDSWRTRGRGQRLG